MAIAVPARRMLLSGDHAVAYGVMLSRAQLIPGYPITPQTPILEKLSELVSSGEFPADLMLVESEHSAMCAAMAASLGGVRVFTATASQGFFYMHEVLHAAAMGRAPVVMVGVNRSHSLPWAFWADHSDSLSQRDTGWIHLYCETAQEALDLVPIAYRIAETVFVPVMVLFEAVYVSHTYEEVEVPPSELVLAYLPPFPDGFRMHVEDPRGYGNAVTPRQWAQHRQRLHEAHLVAPAAARDAFQQWAQLTGRHYGLVDPYRCEDAELILVTIGGPSGTAREAVDALRTEGLRVGVLKQRMVRPVPVDELRGHLRHAQRVAVVDRNCSPGLGGIITQEVRAALHAVPGSPPVHSFLAGLGGTNLSVEDLISIAHMALKEPGPASFGTPYI